MNTALLNLKKIRFQPSGFVAAFTSNYQQGMLLQLSMLMGTGALVWAILVIWSGKYLLAITPVSFIVLTVINIIACKSRNFKAFGCNFQIIISILLPFVFQLFMGGLASSGMVMIWSMVAMGGVLTFARGWVLYRWMSFMLVLMLVSILTDDLAVEHFDNPLDLQSKWFFAINGVLSATTLFFIGIYFVSNQEKTQNLVSETNDQLQDVNRDLYEKNSELINGLRYAETIQKAINPTEIKIRETFKKSFCLQMPKDHVSGDFLWVTKTDEWNLAACVDCTGHGMSGGLLAMMGSCIINGLVHEVKLTEPAVLLSKMHTIITQRLNQKSNGNMDGMEVAMIAHNHHTNELQISTAGGSVYWWKKRTEELERIRLNTTHVGGSLTIQTSDYETHTLQLEPGDRVYMASDGYIDQFGGEHNKKYSRKRFEGVLAELHYQPIEKFQSLLKDKLREWQGENIQTDDIIVFGFEV